MVGGLLRDPAAADLVLVLLTALGWLALLLLLPAEPLTVVLSAGTTEQRVEQILRESQAYITSWSSLHCGLVDCVRATAVSTVQLVLHDAVGQIRLGHTVDDVDDQHM